MTHVQIDDAIFDHPKILNVGKDAKFLYIAGICYCGNRLTDGFIPAGGIAVLAAKVCVTKAKQAVDELVAARLWEITEGGYRVHDYLVYNASAEKVRAKQAAARDRMSHRRSQEVRANFAGTSPEVQEPTTTTDTTTTRSYEPNGSPEREITPPPPSAEGASPPAAVRPHRIPDDFQVDDKLRQWAAEKGFSPPEIEHHTEAFLRHWRSEGSARARKLDWRQAWQGWLLREKPGRWPGAGRGAATPPLPPGFELPPGLSFADFQDWIAYRKAGLSMPEERNVLVDRYLAALNGRVAA